ncbi:MAG: hypothetical protein HDQ94_02265 [Desulfovibrio sp.]|nr:hypothetical protein [Desulfovibrio sp.]
MLKALSREAPALRLPASDAHRLQVPRLNGRIFQESFDKPEDPPADAAGQKAGWLPVKEKGHGFHRGPWNFWSG